jgi:serine/threonine protein kinase
MGCINTKMRIIMNLACDCATGEKSQEKYAEMLAEGHVMQPFQVCNAIGKGNSKSGGCINGTGILGTTDADAAQYAISQEAQQRCTQILALEHVEQPYHLFNQIGKGGFGKVYRAQKIRGDFMYVAVKMINPEPVFRRFYCSEMGTLMDLDHPNIVKFLDGYIYAGQLHIVLEYIPGMRLSIFRKKADCWGNKISGVNITAAIFRQCCLALEHIHAKNFIHGDLKNANIMLDRKGCVKLIDFGLATGTSTLQKPNLGTRRYMAPEIHATPGQYGTAADIWSLGVVLMAYIFDGIPSVLRDFPDVEAIWTRWGQEIPPVVLLLIKSCLQLQPGKRPTATDLLQMELLKYYSYPLERLGSMVQDAMAFSS